MKKSKLALFSAKGLGDGLLTMILSHNLSSLFDVTVFSSNLSHLTNWFPGKTIVAFPKNLEEALAPFDQIIGTENTPLVNLRDSRVTILWNRDFNRSQTMVENLVSFCQTKFKMLQATSDNGLCLPPHVIKNKYPKRIIFHPTSSEEIKNWPKNKFVKLGHQLVKKGWQVSLCVGSHEWDYIKNLQTEDIDFPRFQTLNEFAEYVAESAFLIGNDSGIGHLASNIGLPTISLFARKSLSKVWRPGWGSSSVVLPFPLAIGSKFKQMTWKKFLTVRRVNRAFCLMAKKQGENPLLRNDYL